MISDLIRLGVSVCDYKTHLRRLAQKPKIDVLFISTIRSDVDRQQLSGLFNSGDKHLGLVRMWLDDVCGHIRVINSTYAEVLTPSGARKAKEQAREAISWAAKRGVSTVLFASSTKRLFGDDGQDIKKEFPNILFTIGDNGTAMMLINEIESVTKRAGLSLTKARIAVLGANGFIGQVMVDYLTKRGSEVIGLGTSAKRLKDLAEKYAIQTAENFSEIGKVDIVVACTHLNGSRLNADNIELLRKANRKLLVFDMAQPPNLDVEEYRKCSDKVIRLDSADAYSPKLKYVLGSVGYKATSVRKGVTFGCFSEAFVLTTLLKKGLHEKEIREMDHFKVNTNNVEIIRRFYADSNTGFINQPPRTFGQDVRGLSLDYF